MDLNVLSFIQGPLNNINQVTNSAVRKQFNVIYQQLQTIRSHISLDQHSKFIYFTIFFYTHKDGTFFTTVDHLTTITDLSCDIVNTSLQTLDDMHLISIKRTSILQITLQKETTLF